MNRRGVRLGRVLGVEIVLDPSWFVLAVLIAWLLGQGFAAGTPAFSGGTAVALGVMGAVLFFCSVLAHELAHCVVARRKGIPVDRITLFLLGGAAQISEEPHSPGDEVKIALAGPLLSVCLGAMLFGLGLAADQIGSTAGAALFETIGAINLLLAVFNMLPGFPLDGGRVFRAATWRITGDLRKATRIAAVSGRILGVAMIGTGIVLALSRSNPVNAIWLVLVGLFLHQAAHTAQRAAHIGTGGQPPAHGGPWRRGATVGDLMTTQPEWVASNLALGTDLYGRLVAGRDHAFPVVGPFGRIEGLLTIEGIQAVPREQWALLTAADVMVPMRQEMVAWSGEPYEFVLARLGANPAGRFVVLDDGRLVGVLSPHLGQAVGVNLGSNLSVKGN